MDKFCVYGKLTAVDGKLERLQECMQEVVREMQALDTCYCYILGKSKEDTNSLYIYEVWESEQAHNDSLKLDVFRKIIIEAQPLIAGMENLNQLSIIDGKARL